MVARGGLLSQETRQHCDCQPWDADEVTDPELFAMISETLQRVKTEDPARGRWDVTGTAVVLWVNASSVAMGAVLEVDGEVVEDAS